MAIKGTVERAGDTQAAWQDKKHLIIFEPEDRAMDPITVPAHDAVAALLDNVGRHDEAAALRANARSNPFGKPVPTHEDIRRGNVPEIGPNDEGYDPGLQG